MSVATVPSTESEVASHATAAWPISFQDVVNASRQLRQYLPVTPLRNYQALDQAVGHKIEVHVKHENHLPTNSFKVRNGLSVLASLTPEQRKHGVVAATRGNHGQGVAWAGALLGIPVTICVPLSNNPEKNAAMRGFGATVIEDGHDYDEAIRVAQELVHSRAMTLVHATNNRRVLAGAATMSLEMVVDQAAELDAVVMAIGGGSMAVGALTVLRKLRPEIEVYGVQAEGASAMHESWHAGQPVVKHTAQTIADGLATRGVYEMTFSTLREGLTDFITVSDELIAEAVRMLLKTTHNLAEGAGAAGLAGLLSLRERLAGKRVGIVLSGSNIDETTLRWVMKAA